MIVVSSRHDLVGRFESAFSSTLPCIHETPREFRWRLTCHDLVGVTAVVLDFRQNVDVLTELTEAAVVERRHTFLFAVVPDSAVCLAGDLARRGVDSCLPDTAMSRTIRETMLGSFSRYRAISSTVRDVPEVRSFLVGGSRIMQLLRDRIRRIARSDEPVLITGETGVGKELVARSVHLMSNRSNGPFQTVNIAAVPESLFESELYGVRKGSFTDAAETKPGIFGAADGGSVFLDEIGELSHRLQPKLLRALESGRIRRVGSATNTEISVRVVSATNQNLKSLVQDGDFRRDLWHRLAALRIEVPPLRDHIEDIEELTCYLLKRRNRSDVQIAPNVIEWFTRYTWPGNVRELNAVLGRAIVNADGSRVDMRHIELDGDDTPSGDASTGEGGFRKPGGPEQGDLPGLLPH